MRFALPTPLPSLPDGLTRRAALYGAVTIFGALAGATARATRPSPAIPSEADTQLVTLADAMARAERARRFPGLGASDRAEVVSVFVDAAILMRDTSAGSHLGMAAKAHVLSMGVVGWTAADVETMADIGASLAADVLRLNGGAA